MSSLTFPTRPGPHLTGWAPAPGHPHRADHCRCRRALIVATQAECLRCGRLPRDVIADTWRQAAARMRAAA